MTDELRNLAMFPLERVIVPFGLLPLRIFEPRYKEMFTSLDYEGATFGTALIAAGSEVGGEDRRYDVGCVVEILDRDFSGDSWLVLGRGKSRISIARWIDTETFPLAEVSDIARLPAPELVDVAEVERIFRSVVALCEERLAGRWDPQMELPSDPEDKMMVMAEVVPISTLDKYQVLAANTLDEMADVFLGALDGVVELLNASE